MLGNNPTNATDPSGTLAIPRPDLNPAAVAAGLALRAAVVGAGLTGVAVLTMGAWIVLAAGVSLGLLLGCLVISECREGVAMLLTTERGHAFCVTTAVTGINGLLTLYAKKPYVKPYEVGTYDDLKGRSEPADGLDIHHIPQKWPAGQVIPGYNPKTGPSIALPEGEHGQIPTRTGPYAGAPGELLQGDLDDLFGNTNAPPSVEDEIRDLVDKQYPGAIK